MHLSHNNASAAFEQLNRCLDDDNEWMSTSKLKLNPDKSLDEALTTVQRLDQLVSSALMWKQGLTDQPI